jgi:[FeFe] hydrogenase H-cluster maturation GTPase HydF
MNVCSDLNHTPSANRLHITLFGRRNVGKSSLLNALTGQQVAIVNALPGTTTDPVSKAMELPGIGACLLTDTAGFDDKGKIGEQRIRKSRLCLQMTDLAILVVAPVGKSISFEEMWTGYEQKWIKEFHGLQIPCMIVVNKCDQIGSVGKFTKALQKVVSCPVMEVSALTHEGIDALRKEIIRHLRQIKDDQPSLLQGMVEDGNIVMLVMPQDIQAPEGRLILPQVQTIRALLDERCTVVCCTTDRMLDSLSHLTSAPHWIITDSQDFAPVYKMKPKESKLTSFSILMGACKGDLQTFREGARAIDSLTEHSHVLIAEACTHVPQAEDIGRVKIPRLLRERIGESLQIDICSGSDFPRDLSIYQLIIHCGGCMFNRRFMLSRINLAKAHHLHLTNYGFAIARLLQLPLDF